MKFGKEKFDGNWKIFSKDENIFQKIVNMAPLDFILISYWFVIIFYVSITDK